MGQRAVSAGAGVISWVGRAGVLGRGPHLLRLLPHGRHLPHRQPRTLYPPPQIGDPKGPPVSLQGVSSTSSSPFFRGQLVIAFLQGLLFAIGFTIVGLKYGFVIGLTLGFLNIVPYLGNIIGLATALPLAFFQDPAAASRACSRCSWSFAVVQLIEGYLLTPKIMGDRTGLHPVVIILAIFFWGSALNGIMGMILAIPLTAFLVVFWRLVLREVHARARCDVRDYCQHISLFS